MLVTATNELKFHQWPEYGPEEPYNLSINAEIVSLSCSSDNNYMIYLQEGGKPEILCLRDIHNIKPIHVITAVDRASVVTFQKCTKRTVAIGTSCSTVALYDTKNKTVGKIFTLSGAVVGLDFNAVDEYLVVACKNGIVSLFNVAGGSEFCTFNIGCTPVSICFHPSNRDIFGVGSKDGTVFVFDVHQTNPMYVTKCHFGGINGLVFSGKQDILVSGGSDNQFCVHDYGKNTCIFSGHLQNPITSLDISPEGKHLGFGTDDGSVYIYDAKSYLAPIIYWTPHSTKIRFFKFSSKSDGASDAVTSATSSNYTNLVCPRTSRAENEFKALYNKFINRTEDETFKLLKEDIITDMKKDAGQLNKQMNIHMSNLQEFIKKEFSKMTLQMDDKYNLLNIVSGSYRSPDELATDKFLSDVDNPIVIE